MRKKKVGRPKSDKSKKKVSVKITVDPDVLAEADLSSNVSGWFNELGRAEVNRINKLKKTSISQ